MNKYTVDQIRKMVLDKGFVVFEKDDKPFNLNIVGVRSKRAKLDEFADTLVVFWKSLGRWHIRNFSITTYPGQYYLVQKLLNPRGCAILKEGQYRGVYGIAKHRGKYDALCQVFGDVKVFRDRDRDNEFDLSVNTIDEGEFGINIHRSVTQGATTRVGSHSAGCQVFANAAQFAEFMDIVKDSRDVFGNKFTYTLIEDANN